MRHRSSLFFLLLIPLVLLFAACGGGGGDDDDDSSSPGDSPFAPKDSNDSSGSTSSSKNNAELVAKFEDGNFGSGKVHVEISGDVKTSFDADGSGIATNGFALLTFTNDTESVQIAFNRAADQDPGGLAVNTEKVVAGGGWGTDCTQKLTDSAKELKGEFECKNVDGVAPGSIKVYKVTVKGNFTLNRE
ncbi:MAG: hypothetical protein AB7N24_00085 [Dehalococcoidia bacterium]